MTSPCPCFSLRDHLVRQGVTTKEAMKEHLSFIQRTIEANPSMNLRAYRVDQNNPDGVLQG